MFLCTTADLGSDFVAWAGMVDGRPVAVVTPHAQNDGTVAAQAAELLRRTGISCGACTHCPVGLAMKEA
jgi:hypothetical protein